MDKIAQHSGRKLHQSVKLRVARTVLRNEHQSWGVQALRHSSCKALGKMSHEPFFQLILCSQVCPLLVA